MTLLRCVIGQRYPLGIAHTSLQEISSKVDNALAQVQDEELREALRGMLAMDGQARMKAFEEHKFWTEDLPTSEIIDAPRDFKTTSFIKTEPKHTLSIPLVTSIEPPKTPSSPMVVSTRELSPQEDDTAPLSRRQSSDADFPELYIPTLEYGNPTQQPSLRIVSFIKYALRSAGILYHACEAPASVFASHSGSTPVVGSDHGSASASSSDLSLAENELVGTLYLRCVIEVGMSTA